MQPCTNFECSAEKLNILLHHTFTAGQQQLGLLMPTTSYSSWVAIMLLYFSYSKAMAWISVLDPCMSDHNRHP